MCDNAYALILFGIQGTWFESKENANICVCTIGVEYKQTYVRAYNVKESGGGKVKEYNDGQTIICVSLCNVISWLSSVGVKQIKTSIWEKSFFCGITWFFW